MQNLIIILAVFICSILLGDISYGAIDAQAFSKCFEGRNGQKYLAGNIDSLTLIIDDATITLIGGKLKLYNFKADQYSAFTYEGDGRATFQPPENAETNQIIRYTENSILNLNIKKINF